MLKGPRGRSRRGSETRAASRRLGAKGVPQHPIFREFRVSAVDGCGVVDNNESSSKPKRV